MTQGLNCPVSASSHFPSRVILGWSQAFSIKKTSLRRGCLGSGGGYVTRPLPPPRRATATAPGTGRCFGGAVFHLRVAMERWVGTAAARPAAQPSIAASRRRASRRRCDEWDVATVSVVASRRRASRREAPRRARRDGEMGGHGRSAARGAAEHRGVTAASVAATSRRVGRRDGERGGVAAASGEKRRGSGGEALRRGGAIGGGGVSLLFG